MKIIIAPAKKMQVDGDSFAPESTPAYLAETNQLLAAMHQLNYAELKTLWHCSDKLAQTNYQSLQQLDLEQGITPALMAFVGIQYQYMAPDLFTTPALDYVKTNLRILSGFYGILRPFDGIVPYRLEMQAPLQVNQHRNLYDFWSDKLYAALATPGEPIINLASQEYAKAIRRYLTPTDHFVDVIFGHLVDGKVKTRATLAKMARGEMVRFMAENNVQTLAELTQFNHLDYHYDAQRSTDHQLVFLH
ncbi:peroxide stress protein YaaA [Levilactobacillus bambusae]|uniref:UPF0246 protein DCM90_05780 n=1 Tax=Levilactobacillus bambusae TaxID=2024736 RepID=A0A2V1N091_9LACO|nr:peroxide stress protein YaaA [Levilactobacillus bambusae]PWG00433.1 peroxide stress protein YaaA [Levilactobacillus bambusae]